MSTHSYLFHGLKLTISGEAGILAALACRLRHFPTPASDAPSHLQIHFQPTEAPVGPGIQRPRGQYREVLQVGEGRVFYFEKSRQISIDFPGCCRALGSLETGEATVWYRESAGVNPQLLAHSCFTILLSELLKPHGLYMVHAAGLSLNGKGLLVAGASGAGKTTLTIALIRAGYGFLGDDTVFLSLRATGLRALAFPDEIGVTASTARFFPELRDLAEVPSAQNRPKHSLDYTRFPNARPSWECSPAVLVFPQPAGASASVLTPLPKDQALIELVCNVLRTDPHLAQAHLDALAAMVQQCACFRLQTGRDFDSLSALLRAVLERTPPALSL